MDDLEIVAILDADLMKGGSGHYLKVAFDRNAQRIEPEAVHHCGDRRAAGYTPVLAVDADCEAAVETHRETP